MFFEYHCGSICTFLLRAVSLAGGHYRWRRACGRRALGNSQRSIASILTAALWTRPSGIIGPICRDVSRCDGVGNLFQRGPFHSSRHAAVAAGADRGGYGGDRLRSQRSTPRLQLSQLFNHFLHAADDEREAVVVKFVRRVVRRVIVRITKRRGVGDHDRRITMLPE